MKKRLLAMLMALALLVSLMPMGVLAYGGDGTDDATPGETREQKQIDGSYYSYNENTHQFEATGDTESTVTNRETSPNVTISKEIAATGTENVFDITLTVETDEAIETSTAQPDAAIVLVIDKSWSMVSCAYCSGLDEHSWGYEIDHYSWCEHKRENQTRLKAAQAAAKEFLEAYAGFENGTYNDPNAARYVSIVTFDGSADTVSFGSYGSRVVWLDLHGDTEEQTKANLERVEQTINNIQLGSSTDIDDGLKEAESLLENDAVSEIDNTFVLLLTDGEPNDNTGDNLNHNSGYSLPSSYPDYLKNNRDYSNPAKRAMYIRNMLGAEFYSVFFGSNDNMATWMTSFSDEFREAEDSDELHLAFQDIIFRLLLSVDAWKVTDPMGHYINYNGVENLASHANDAISFANNTLTWDLRADLASNATTIKDKNGNTISFENYKPGMDCTITYTLTYRVTLDVAAMVQAGVTFTNGVSDYLLTNGATKLDYYLTQTTQDGETIFVDDEGDPIKSGENTMLTMYFKVPKVKGYVGSLEFTKIGSDTQSTLAGATFSLSNDDWSATPVTTDSNGKVSFTNIPSGHIYTLSETATPTGYQELKDITITVSYGEVSYQDGTFGGSAGSLTLTNQASTGTLTVTKTVTGLDNGIADLPTDFAIEVKDGNTTVATLKYGTDGDESDSVYYSTSGTWEISVAPGTYTVTESNYQVDGYSVEAVGNDNSVTVNAGGAAALALTNTYTEQVPGLEVTKTLDKVNDVTYVNGSMVKVGDTLTYTITVTNTGTTTLTDVVVTDTIDGNGTVNLEASDKENVTITGTTAKIDSLAPKASVTITATYEVVSADAGKTIKNTAVAKSDDAEDEPENPPEVKVENPKLTVTKTAAVDGELLGDNASVNIGDEITYTITVTNDGNTTFDKVYVYDEMMVGDVQISVNGETSTTVTLDGGYTIEPTGGFNPNDVVTLTYSYKATEDDIESGISNTAVAEGGDTKDDDTVEIDVNDPSVSINKTVTGYNDKAMEGDELTYTITVENTGNTKLDVTVSDDMWTYGKVSSAELDGVGIDVTSGKYTIFGLDAGESKAITYTYTVTAQDVANGKIDNAATADINNDGIPDDKHEVTTPTGDPSLTVEKTADASTVQVGTPITYTVEVKNDGYSVMNNVVISDTLWTSDTAIEAIGDVTGEYDTGESKYYIGKLEPGEYVTLTYTYTPTEAGRLENKVTVTSDGLDTVPEDSVIVDVTPEPTPDEPGISVTKNVSDRTPDVGDTITYYINVENTGNTVIDEFTVKDSMWEYGMPIYVDGEPAYVNSDDAYTVKTADLEPGGSITISYTYSVRYADEGDRITNYVTVTTPGDGPSDNDYVIIDVDDITPIVPDPDDDDDDDTVYVPNWLNTTDHFAYLIGYEDGEIKPENNITRAEVATIFFRLLTDDARARFWSSENDYTDVATDSWYNNAISTLSNMGIINGYDDGSFQPNASITRAEFTAIATRFFDYTAEYDGAFNDVASGSWYADYVQTAVDMGLVDGYPDGGFHPNSYITRAEAVTIVNRVLNRVPHEDYLLSTRVMNTWPDNVYGAWYYADMQEATNSHDYDWIRVSGERVEEWTEKLPERDWAALEQQWSTAYSG